MQQLSLTTPDPVMTAATPRSPKNHITRANFLKLTEWLKTKDVKQFKSVPALTATALEETAIDLTPAHVRSALEALGIDHFTRKGDKPSPEISAWELSQATAAAVADLFARSGLKPAAAFSQALARAGIPARPIVPV